MGVSASVHAGIPHTLPLGADTPPPGADTPPWGADTPLGSRPPPLGADTPPEQTPPGADTPPPPPEIRSLLRTVRILLECILVITISGEPVIHMKDKVSDKEMEVSHLTVKSHLRPCWWCCISATQVV